LIISFGEAATVFEIETIARQERNTLAQDEHFSLPPKACVYDEGEQQYDCCFDAHSVLKRIEEQQPIALPWVISKDAGQYLCDEMFYTCETQRRKQLANADAGAPKLKLTAFVHVPVHGTPIKLVDSDETVECTEDLLSQISEIVVKAFVNELDEMQHQQQQRKTTEEESIDK
jgi:pyrrolidone-carboxylate peptidase